MIYWPITMADSLGYYKEAGLSVSVLDFQGGSKALEALFGAVFLDAGFEAARRVIESVYAGEFANLDPAKLSKDPKTRLQEWLQARKLAVPEYIVMGMTGEAHAQAFAVECRIPALSITAGGTGGSRRAAEQAAATAAYAIAVAHTGTASHG